MVVHILVARTKGRKMVEKSRLDDRLPSQVSDDFWIYARSEEQHFRGIDGSELKIGKWQIFIPKGEQLDKGWIRIRDAIREEGLTFEAKVSTERHNPNATNPNVGVIIVYTYDFENIDDVKRVGYALFKEGFAPIYYKTDIATLSGEYTSRGRSKVSLYGISKEGTFLQRGVNW